MSHAFVFVNTAAMALLSLAGNALSVLVDRASRAPATSAKKDVAIGRHAVIRALALVTLLILAIKPWFPHLTTVEASTDGSDL